MQTRAQENTPTTGRELPTSTTPARARRAGRWSGRAALVGVALLATACSSASLNPTSGSPTTLLGGTSAPKVAATTTTTAVPVSGKATVDVAQTSLGPTLVTSSGMTLYHDATEKATKTSGGIGIVCTGACLKLWTPLTPPSSGTPTGGPGVTGLLGTVKRPGGSMQVTYDKMPLYTYNQDTKAGQTAGQGYKGIWFAVGPKGAIG